MKTVINGKTINITKAGYLYINGVKQSERIITPTVTLKELTSDQDAIELCREYNSKQYTMSDPNSNKAGHINSYLG